MGFGNDYSTFGFFYKTIYIYICYNNYFQLMFNCFFSYSMYWQFSFRNETKCNILMKLWRNTTRSFIFNSLHFQISDRELEA
jgi:hypothetical protein